ncbi:NTF2 fold immunity protein [Paraburkholderia sp. J67]|uniref:NTF2 fold immunity protein n=1 Tax=Paraburkholderia sp. J67 TaxID=2805435 RepID=UPI002ABD2857|nr:NTF2 fold immunity protein [Paraburkholderia sp. J67]
MEHDELIQAREALKAFMLEMNHWEIRFYQVKKHVIEAGQSAEIVDDEARKALVEILDKWAFADKANHGRLIGLGCTEPPTYDPDSDVEERAEVSGDTVVFVFRQTGGLQSLFQFTLRRRGVEWRIKKKELLNYKDKWQRSVL